MKPKDWTLLVICAANNQGMSPVQLQKSLFLLERQLSEDIQDRELGEDFYKFEPYNYGPFDVSIYQDAEHLEERGLIGIRQSFNHRWKIYQATPNGYELAIKLRTEVSPNMLKYLDSIVTWVLAHNFRELVLAIYQKYPEFRANSVFQE